MQDYIQQLPFSVSDQTQQQMVDFLALLQQWNQAFNLTAITDPDKVITHHLMDSLSIAPYVTGNTILDVGTGAGFPGIPLALLYPDKQFTLLDSNGKKTRFLQQVKATLSLKNVQVVQERVEKYHTEHCFDAIICRAVGEAAEIIDNTRHLLCDNGQWLLMKGAIEIAQHELSNIKESVTLKPLTVPGLDAVRHLVIVRPNSKESA